jgi:hypothetical protein
MSLDPSRSVDIVNFGLPWQVWSYLKGYTLGPHQTLWACKKPLFYGAFSKPIYYGGEEGILCQGPKDLENCSKISVSDNRGGLCVPAVCTGPSRSAQAESNEW